MENVKFHFSTISRRENTNFLYCGWSLHVLAYYNKIYNFSFLPK